MGELGYETENRSQPTKSYEVSYHLGQLKFNPAGELDGAHVSEDTARGVGEVGSFDPEVGKLRSHILCSAIQIK